MLLLLLSRLLAALSAVFLLAFIYFFFAWIKEKKRLRILANSVVNKNLPGLERLKTLNSWVYNNKGFAKNQGFILWKRLGPRPSHILEAGGDCADKSRLLAAMLREVDVKATLAMMYPTLDGEPVHTIVFARTSSGLIASDPVYDVTFSTAENPVTVPMLVADPSLMLAALRHARSIRPSDDKIHFYDEATHHFDFVTTINWRKNAILRSVAKCLALLGIDSRFVFRPQLLEDPLLFISTASICFAMVAFVAALSLINF